MERARTLRGRTCILCGTPIEGSGLGGLCPKCYAERYGVARLPSTVKFVYCTGCGAYRYQGGWNEGLESVEETMTEYLKIYLTSRLKPTEHLEEAWIDGVSITKPFTGPGVYEVHVDLRGVGAGGRVEVGERAVVRVEASAGLCPHCAARMGGRGYQAEVKIRGYAGRLSSETLEEVKRALSRVSRGLEKYLVRVEESDGGLDLYLTDQQAARIIAGKLRSLFPGDVIESYKLVGRRPSGKRKGRLTISLRVLEAEPGDLVVVEGRKHIYLSSTRQGILVIDLEKGVERVVRLGGRTSRRDVKVIPLEEAGSDVRRLMLLSMEGPTTVFLDADSDYREVVEVPSGRVRVYVESMKPGKVYMAYRVGDKIYVVRSLDSGGEQ